MALLGEKVDRFLRDLRINRGLRLETRQQLPHGAGVEQRSGKAMLASLTSLFQNVDVFLGKGRCGRAFECQLIVVSVDQLRQAQRTSHPSGATADDDHIGFHLGPFDALDWLAEVNFSPSPS